MDNADASPGNGPGEDSPDSGALPSAAECLALARQGLSTGLFSGTAHFRERAAQRCITVLMLKRALDSPKARVFEGPSASPAGGGIRFNVYGYIRDHQVAVCFILVPRHPLPLLLAHTAYFIGQPGGASPQELR